MKLPRLFAALAIALMPLLAFVTPAAAQTSTPPPGYTWVLVGDLPGYNASGASSNCCGLPAFGADWSVFATGSAVNLWGGNTGDLNFNRVEIFGIQFLGAAPGGGDAAMNVYAYDGGTVWGSPWTFYGANSEETFAGRYLDNLHIITANPHYLEADAMSVLIGTPATPTPTAGPTSTPMPQSQACIPASSISTPTLIAPRMTPTPYGTRTPGPAGTPTPAATPLPAGVSIKAAFDASLAPWTNNGLAAWGSGLGTDNRAGLAVLPFTAGATVSTAGDAIALGAAPPNALVYVQPNIPRPWRIVADAITTDAVPVGYRAYVQVFEWHDGGLGGGSWVLVSNQPVSHAWGVITAASTYTDTVHGIALRAVMGSGDIYNPLGFSPIDSAISVNVDNVVIAAGPDYWNSSYYTGLPVCSASNNPTLAAAQTKICPVAKIQVNVFKCQRPADLLNIGGWIEYLWCNVSAYFNFGKENQDQLTALRERQNANEPAGSLAEVPASLGVISSSLDTFRTRYGGTRARGLDWGALLTVDVNNVIPTHINAPDPNQAPVSGGCYLGDSPVTFSDNDRVFACTAIAFIESSPLPAVFQFLIYIAGGAIVIMYIFNRWINKGAASEE